MTSVNTWLITVISVANDLTLMSIEIGSVDEEPMVLDVRGGGGRRREKEYQSSGLIIHLFTCPALWRRVE